MNRKEWRELTGGGGFSISYYPHSVDISDWDNVLQLSRGGIQIFREVKRGSACTTTLTPWQETQVGGKP